MQCSECPFSAKSRAGLAAHKRRAHPESLAATGPNATAIDVTLAELRRMGRLEKIDEARVQALRSMAVALDQNPFNSQMWREYREAIEGLTADDSNTDGVDALLDELSTPVRDASKG
jgi:phage tail sheath protein FI